MGKSFQVKLLKESIPSMPLLNDYSQRLRPFKPSNVQRFFLGFLFNFEAPFQMVPSAATWNPFINTIPKKRSYITPFNDLLQRPSSTTFFNDPLQRPSSTAFDVNIICIEGMMIPTDLSCLVVGNGLLVCLHPRLLGPRIDAIRNRPFTRRREYGW